MHLINLAKECKYHLYLKLDRRKIQSDISESVRAFMQKEKTGFKKGGVKNVYTKGGDVADLKTVAGKLRKASKAHAGQAKVFEKELSLNMFRLIELLKNLLNLDYRVRRLERAKYWKEKISWRD